MVRINWWTALIATSDDRWSDVDVRELSQHKACVGSGLQYLSDGGTTCAAGFGDHSCSFPGLSLPGFGRDRESTTPDPL